jgi:hypothetical protein
MRTRLRRKAAVIPAAVLSLAALAGCTTSEASPRADVPTGGAPGGPSLGPAPRPSRAAAAEPLTLRTDHARQSPGVVAAGGGDAPYNYAPSVMVDGGRYRMWWCSQLGIANPPGDDILYAESASLDGGFRGPDGRLGTPIFAGSGTGFDAMHVCDPSVIRAGGTYYMYYTGSAGDHAHGNAIGLATSLDGRVWTQRTGPVVKPARNVSNENVYGAGQPSAVYLDGWFYLMFTDTSGRDVGWNGAGQFVLRAKDPTFASGVEALAPGGFRAVPDTLSRFRSVADAFSADLMWVDALAAFAIAHETADGTTITFWDKDFRVNPYRDVVVGGAWREGPGLVRHADGHAPVPLDAACDTVPVDLVRATREGPAGPTDLRHFGLDLAGVGACGSADRALLTLAGYAMPSPKRTIDLVVPGGVVRIERRSVAEALAVRVLDRRPPVFTEVTVAAELRPGVPAVRAEGRGVGFLIDGKLWLIPSAEVAARNSSTVADVSQLTWDSYARGADLVSSSR